jgi:hypothetical protein
MTIQAALVRYGVAEIGAFVAFGARHFRVLARQGKLRRGVIEVRAGAATFEAIGVVTVIAGALKLSRLEGPTMGIVVTALAAAVS